MQRARPSWLRPLAAALATLLALAATGAPLTGPMSSYAATLPLLVGCAAWLAGVVEPRHAGLAALAASVLVLAPAVGFRVTREGIDVFEARYLLPDEALLRILSVATHTPRGTAPLLLAAGLGVAVAFGRRATPVAGAALGAAAGGLLSRHLLRAAATAWRQGEVDQTARLAWLAGAVGLLAGAGALLGLAAWRRPTQVAAALRRAPALLVVLGALAAGWAATPPIGPLARSLPLPAPPGAVLRAPPGPASAAALVDLDDPAGLAAQLVALGFHPVREGVPPCEGAAPFEWASFQRNTVGLALAPDTPVAALAPILPVLYAHGVDQLALLARGPPLPGPFGARARWPRVRLVLDPPPPGVRWYAAASDVPTPLTDTPWFAAGVEVCVLRPAPGLTIGELYTVARALSGYGEGGPCQDALGLALPEASPVYATPGGCAEPPSLPDALLVPPP